MDLAAEAQRLRLDLLAVRVCATLEDAGIPCVLLKGPTTSTWLYDPPRPYNDVDVLVPLSRATESVRTLDAAGVATPDWPVTIDAKDNWMLHSSEGYEVDIHLTLPALERLDDAAWATVAPHVTRWDTGVGVVPALDLPARCLVLALHALNSDVAPERPLVDLQRALARTGDVEWTAARQLARGLDAEDLLDAGLHLANPTGQALSPRAGLFVARAPSTAFGLERLLRTSRRDAPRALFRAVLPSREYLQLTDSKIAPTRSSLWAAHLRRWSRILRQMPRAVLALRRARTNRELPKSRTSRN